MRMLLIALAAITGLLMSACSARAPDAAMPGAVEVAATPAPASPAAPEQALGKRAPGDTTPPMAVFRAFGTEPFWNVNVEDATLTFTTPEDQVGVTLQGERRATEAGVEIAGNHDGKAFRLTVAPGTCSDGMSDNQYTLTSSFDFGDTGYTGCAEAAK